MPFMVAFSAPELTVLIILLQAIMPWAFLLQVNFRLVFSQQEFFRLVFFLLEFLILDCMPWAFLYLVGRKNIRNYLQIINRDLYINLSGFEFVGNQTRLGIFKVTDLFFSFQLLHQLKLPWEDLINLMDRIIFFRASAWIWHNKNHHIFVHRVQI